MQVPDALSRCIQNDILPKHESQAEEDLFFPCAPEKVTETHVPTDYVLHNLLHRNDNTNQCVPIYVV